MRRGKRGAGIGKWGRGGSLGIAGSDSDSDGRVDVGEEARGMCHPHPHPQRRAWADSGSAESPASP